MGLVFFLLFLLPSFANFSRAGEIYFTSDRYFYLPLVGLLLVAGSLFDRALRREHERIVQRPGSALLLVVLVLFGFLTIRQSKVWQNSDTFYAAAIAENPQSAALHYNRGLLWQQHGEMHMALAEYTLALQYNPLLAKAHNNVGAIFWTMQMNIAAKNEYLQALALDPAYAEAHDNLGLALMRLERYEAAKQEFQRALALAPSDAQAQANLDETEARLERQ
jgi:tetratricopeptide (TPR) repeat protein